MSKRPMRLGELLVRMGRVTDDDITRALAYQQEHGGYLGDALIELGALTREELRWSLADQYDIPFVRLRPENIDRGLAAMVPAAWAREHHMLPVLRVGDEVTVVLGDVTNLEKLEEVRRMTGAASVEAALSSPEAIQELVDAVYAPVAQSPVRLTRLMEDALAHGATTLGVSVRQGGAIGWYRVVERVERPLLLDWEGELAAALSPLHPLNEPPPGVPRSWRGLLSVGDRHWWAECASAGQGRSTEWSARLTGLAERNSLFPTVDPDLAVEVRHALSRGPLLVRARAPNDAAAGRAVARLPELLLGPDARSIHLTDVPVAAGPDVLVLRLAGTAAQQAVSIGLLYPQALTADVDRLDAADVRALAAAAPFTVVRSRAGAPQDIAFKLELHLRADAGGYVWSLSDAGNGKD